MCRKIAHPTRAAAERQLKQVVWRNASHHEDGRSKGLNVYRCRVCRHWHIGHAAKKEGEACR